MSHAGDPAKKRKSWLFVVVSVAIVVVIAAVTLVALQPAREGYNDIATDSPDAVVHVGDVIHSQADYGGFFDIGRHLRSWQVVKTADGLKLAPIVDTDSWTHCVNRPNVKVYRVPDSWVEPRIDLTLSTTC